jgi:hypothetical protein
MAERSEEAVLSGLLQISVGGVVRPMPTLPIKYIPEWAKLLDAATPSAIAQPDPDEGFVTIARATNAGLLDLVVAYDRTGALGGREWLEEHADPAELKGAAMQMADNAFPFGEAAAVIGTMVTARIRQSVAGSAPPSSTNGSSPTGASTRKRSARALTRSS